MHQESTKDDRTQSKNKAVNPKKFKVPSMPPIYIHNSSKWKQIFNSISEKNIKLSNASRTKDGVRAFPKSVGDFRALTELLDELEEPYHTYTLPEDKVLHVVIRGYAPCMTNENVRNEIEQLGYHPIEMFRMKSKFTKEPTFILKATFPLNEASIYQVTVINHLNRLIEPQDKITRIPQCHRCQKFWHSQDFCHGVPRCVKCAGEHLTTDCRKRPNSPPKCANCSLAHPANYRGCKAFPKMPKKINLAKRYNRLNCVTCNPMWEW